MYLQQIFLKARMALIHWELRHLETHRRRALAEFMLAVDDGRHAAQDLYFQRGAYIAKRKAQLESKLRTIKKEIK